MEKACVVLLMSHYERLVMKTIIKFFDIVMKIAIKIIIIFVIIVILYVLLIPVLLFLPPSSASMKEENKALVSRLQEYNDIPASKEYNLIYRTKSWRENKFVFVVNDNINIDALTDRHWKSLDSFDPEFQRRHKKMICALLNRAKISIEDSHLNTVFYSEGSVPNTLRILYMIVVDQTISYFILVNL